ncbi:hypothetical protein DXG03_009209 [Asterophora parasitica]|uniref:CCHC-type domain-containing protein n=1 Tax=Asterophora parasitica TaxID=117018 RepID=A0A9P7K6N2_9AGAR|nr:hypothetical protein DXG03_009209 [Asterophora parasitica]
MFQTNTASALQNIMQQLANVAATLQNMSTAPLASQANPQAPAAPVPPPAPPMMSLASLPVTAPAVTLAASPPAATAPTVAVTPVAAAPSRLCLPLLVAFTGERSDSHRFIQACKLYFTLAPATQFAMHTQAIAWALMQMQEGQGAKYLDQIVREGITQFASWDNFRDAFAWEFYEPDVEHKHDIDAYIDSFRSLYRKAGYPDRRHLIMKFCHGLSKRISDRLGNITTGCPNDTHVEAWMTVVREQAFIMKTEADFSWGRLAAKPAERMPATVPGRIPITPPHLPPVFTNPAPFRPLLPPVVHPATAAALPVPKLLPMGVPMDIDKMQAACAADVVCHHCHQKGHYRQECPLRYNVRFMDNDKRGELTMQLLAWEDTLVAESQAIASDDSETHG